MSPDLVATPHLGGTERLRARHVSRAFPLIEVDFPGHRVSALAHLRNGATQPAELLLDTLVLFAAEAQVVIAWRARFPSPGRLYNLFAVEIPPEGATPRAAGGAA